MSARAVFALPLCGGAGTLAEALESLLHQSDSRLRVVIADESPEGGAEAARAYAGLDERVVHVSGLSPAGPAQRRRRALALAVRSAPAAPYVAWASDRDVWNPRWLAALGGVLDANAACVLAFARSERIDQGGELVASVRHDLCDTRGLDLRGRLRAVEPASVAGDAVHGLMRVDALAPTARHRFAAGPDWLTLRGLAARGDVVQVPQTLWYQRVAGDAQGGPVRAPETKDERRAAKARKRAARERKRPAA